MRLFKRTLGNGKKSKVWWFEFVHRGVRYQQTTGISNRKQATDYAAAFRLRLIEGELRVNRKQAAPSFASAMADFLEHSTIQHKKHPGTTQRYQVASRPLLGYFGKALIDQIGPEDVEKYRRMRSRAVSDRTGRKLRPATINRELACLKAMFNYHLKNDLIDKNPVSRVKFENEDNEQMRTITLEEEALYLAAASQPLRDIAVLMLQTGMRPEEVYRIERGNVHLGENYLFNPYGKTKAARRKISLTETAAEVLRRRLAEIEGPFLFPHQEDRHKAMVKVNAAHTGAVKRAGLKHFRLYDLRHTFATRAAQSGVDLVTLAAILGHSRIQMVMRYAHPTETHQAEAIKKMEDYVNARQEAIDAGRSAMVN